VECALVHRLCQRLARHPFVAISLLAGLQTISPSLYEAADRRRHALAAVPP
jgi:ABC-type Fe3+ transport system permease subunit